MGFDTNVGKTVEFYNKRLNKISKQGIPMAAASTLNNMAFESMMIAKKIFKASHVIRSNWTERGMLFQKVKKGTSIQQMETRSGNIRPYTETLEDGATIRPKSKFVAIPALGARISKNIKKRIASKFAINKIQARRMPNISGSPTRRFAAMLNIARKEKYFGPFAVTESEAGSDLIPTGIFNLTGRGRGKRYGGTITMLRKLQTSVVVPGHPFVEPAGRKVAQNMDKIYVRQAKRILAKFGSNIR